MIEKIKKYIGIFRNNITNDGSIKAIDHSIPIAEVEEGFNFISNFMNAEILGPESCLECIYPEYNHKEWIYITTGTINKDERKILFEHPAVSAEDPTSTIIFKNINIAHNASIEFGIGIVESAWRHPGDGVEFELLIQSNEKTTSLYRKYIDPKNNLDDRMWFDEKIELTPYEGKSVNILLKTSAGPRGNVDYCWAGWSNPVVTYNGIVKYKFIELLDQSFILVNRKRQAIDEIFYIGDDVRQGILMQGDVEIYYKNIRIPEGAMLKFGINGFCFQDGCLRLTIIIKINDDMKEIFSEQIDMRENKYLIWIDREINLSKYNGKEIDFKIKVSCDKESLKIGISPFKIVPRNRKYIRKPIINHTNVLLITLDAVRYDYLGFMGHGYIQTPNLNSLAKAGVVFLNNFSQANITIPSHLSILSSKYPRTINVMDNYKYKLPSLGTIAEKLTDKGYSNSAFVGVEILNPSWCNGIENGFNEYFQVMGNQRMAEHTINLFHNWVKENCTKPFFTWMHLFDAHNPYLPSKPFYGLYSTEKMGGMNNPEVQVDNIDVLRGITDWLKVRGINDINFPMTQYAAEITYLDHNIGKIFNTLKNLGLWENTIIIITSDHGECLGEHNIYFDHQGLYDEATHIPLIMHYPKILPENKIVNGLSMNVDIVPTILDILGYHDGDMEGKSLMPLIKSEKTEIHDFVISENTYGSQVALRTSKWKYIKSLKDMGYTKKFNVRKGNIELYNLIRDPKELQNIASEHPEMVNEFEEKLTCWLNEREICDNKVQKMDVNGEIKKKLELLGYF